MTFRIQRETKTTKDQCPCGRGEMPHSRSWEIYRIYNDENDKLLWTTNTSSNPRALEECVWYCLNKGASIRIDPTDFGKEKAVAPDRCGHCGK